MGLRSRRWLKDQAQTHARIIEVGSWLGRSTRVMAKHCPGTVWAIDHWQGAQHDPMQASLYAEALATRDVYAEFRRNLRRDIASGKVIPMRMSSAEAHLVLLNQFGLASFDMVFIDADHSYQGCLADIEHYFQLIRPGGLVCGHDYGWPGVRQAVNYWFGQCVQREVTLGPKSLWSAVV
jgi:predicted O-methyltransferase YrrM